MKLLIVFLAASGALFWLGVAALYVRLVARKVRQARGLAAAGTAAQETSGAAQASAAESLGAAYWDALRAAASVTGMPPGDLAAGAITAFARQRAAEAQEAASRLAIAMAQAADGSTR